MSNRSVGEKMQKEFQLDPSPLCVWKSNTVASRTVIYLYPTYNMFAVEMYVFKISAFVYGDLVLEFWTRKRRTFTRRRTILYIVIIYDTSTLQSPYTVLTDP